MATGNAKQQEQNTTPKPAKVIPVDTSIELPQPTRSLEQVKADLDRAGFAILEGVLTDAESREVRDIVDSEIRREEALDENTVRRFYTDPDAKNRRLSRLPNRHKWLRDLLEHPVALEMTRHILGPQLFDESFLVHSYGANITRPGSAQQFIHRDRGVAQPFIDGALQSRFIWCLDDFTAENGATRMVPGSHKWGHAIDMTGQSFYESVAAEAPRGSLIIYTDMVLHGTGANVSADKERAGVIVGYCPPWCRPMINFPLVLDPAALKDSSVTLRQLLGYSSVSIGFDEQWESASDELRALNVPVTMQW